MIQRVHAQGRGSAIFLFRNKEKSIVEKIKEELKRKNKKPSDVILNAESLPKSDRSLIDKIVTKTGLENLNNISRTKAYLDFYRHHPEIHWAFLGHMVSRNGGWNMTDLKGEFLTRVLSRKEQQRFFDFLERGNWLIFQDIFPQFLLYEESLRQRKPLFYLSPYFGVSTFMETVWNHFWRNRDFYVLTVALVVNEQSYLEKRVVQNPLYKKEVLGTIEFKLQDLLSFNHILFPYGRKNLSGQTLHQFDSLYERILLGKRLYAILFQNKEFLKQVEEWAFHHPHTGSRKDYWPDVFNDVNEGTPGFAYQLHLKGCQLMKGARKLYSPGLENAWKNVSHQDAEIGDWFVDPEIANFLLEDYETVNGEIKNEYCKTLEQLELAVLAKKAISLLD